MAETKKAPETTPDAAPEAAPDTPATETAELAHRRPAARGPARDGHLPRDDRAPPGGPRQVRAGPQRRRGRGFADRAGDAAHAGEGRHRRPVRALRDRHPGQDRPGGAAPGRHRARHRAGPAAPARQALHAGRAVHPLGGRPARGRQAVEPGGPGPDAQRPGPDRDLRPVGRARAAGGRRRGSQHHRAGPPRRHGRLQPRPDRPSSARSCWRRSTSSSGSSWSAPSSPARSRSWS